MCISCSGSSSLPAPTFSKVWNLSFLKPTTWVRMSTSPWLARPEVGGPAGLDSNLSRMRTLV